MKILVIGRGGRESAIVKNILKSKLSPEVYCAPGNAQTSKLARNIAIEEIDIKELLNFALINKIDLTIVGPESALEKGIADLFQENGLKIFGPSRNAAQIETSKTYSKDIMIKYSIPTASYKSFDDAEEAIKYAKTIQYPHVIKYDGLASGKGVIICESYRDMENQIKLMLSDKSFGEANKIILEDFLEGEEFTILSLVKDDKVYPLEVSRDYKRAYDNDYGLNTGGMGAICPFDKILSEDKKEAIDILKKTAQALVYERNNFCGVLYGGFIKTSNGVKVIEFNARFGDPETEVVLQKLQSDLVEEILKLLNNEEVNIINDDRYYVGVTMAAKGYPTSYDSNFELNGEDDCGVFHMGTISKADKVLSAGGRVLFISDSGRSLKEAKERAYMKVKKYEHPKLFYRSDIAE